jgi:hypothetical protein
MEEVKKVKIAELEPAAVMDLMGVDRETAEFYIAIERGDISGDAIQEERSL